jgi:hypothetical protein
MLENKVYVLEQTLGMVKMSLHSLQSALIAISNTQDSIGRDVCNIGEVIENIVNVFEIEPQTHLSLVTTNPDDDLPN